MKAITTHKYISCI